jgi:glucose/arabinose dehydrogenase
MHQGIILPPLGKWFLPGIPTCGYHNGGHLVFDGSGNLMISTGDAQTSSNAQSLTSLAGKVLRIRPNASSPGYIIPPGNPFGNDASRRREIWCWGLRNPWSIDQEMHTTRFYIGDVGPSGDEDIDDGSTFANFGWPTHEGPVGSRACRTTAILSIRIRILDRQLPSQDLCSTTTMALTSSLYTLKARPSSATTQEDG